MGITNTVVVVVVMVKKKVHVERIQVFGTCCRLLGWERFTFWLGASSARCLPRGLPYPRKLR